MGFAGNLGLDDTLVQSAIASQNNESASVVQNNGVIEGRKSGPERRENQQNIRDARDNENKSTNKQEKTNTSATGRYRPKRHIRKINGGRVLQYPIDIDTNIQDYFEIQVFRYRAAGRLATINTDTEEQLGSDSEMAGYNRRYNRQNLRLEDLQSTIQIPIPNSLKDINAVGWGEDNLNPLNSGGL